MNSGLKVVDIMTVSPVMTLPTTSLHDAAQLMERHNVGSVLITRGKELLGIVTERDYVTRACLEGHDPLHTPVSRVMTKDLLTVNPGTDVFDALLLMKDAEVRHLPVVHDNQLVGFITAKDILKVQPQLFDNFVDNFEIREERRKFARAQQAVLHWDEEE